MTMTQQDDQSELINEYIKNLAAKVNELQAENILLKTRLSLLETANVAKAQQEQQVQDGGDFGKAKEETAPTPAPEPMKVNQRPGSQKKRDVSGQFIEEK
jgi:hypothetical protein|tara:strand:- start:1102 stop:1401 length:300 start_codon:yes stop_codon:yes gene_type:complete